MENKISEVPFSEYILARHPMKCVHGILYDWNGKVDEEMLRKELLDIVRPYVMTNVAKAITRLVDALKLCAFSEELEADTEQIHFQNGTYRIADRNFRMEKRLCWRNH